MKYTLGIDIGSRNTKIVVFAPDEKNIVFSAYSSTEISAVQGVEKLLQLADKVVDTSQIISSCVTGYGRKLYKAANTMKSEISCHAVGCNYLFPEANSIIDIGGQDSKIITLNPDGSVNDFVMNDKCAAGTGRFLEMTAMRLGVDLDSLSLLASASDKELQLNNTCVVFAESEIIGLLAEGHNAENIARAVNNSIARRIFAQMSSLNCKAPIVFTGGVALGKDLALCLSKLVNSPLLIANDPEITGALGAAILAI